MCPSLHLGSSPQSCHNAVLTAKGCGHPTCPRFPLHPCSAWLSPPNNLVAAAPLYPPAVPCQHARVQTTRRGVSATPGHAIWRYHFLVVYDKQVFSVTWGWVEVCGQGLSKNAPLGEVGPGLVRIMQLTCLHQ
uniref:Uncharacterized protein n=1 Tax=Eutreptiella gymnastica TaxID=73025 RepID=A0A7S4CW42_9EUGL